MTKSEIKISIEKQVLQLNFWQKLSHYGIVLGILIISITIGVLSIKDILSGNRNHISVKILSFIIVPFLFTIFFYFLQKKRLRFNIIETNLSLIEIKNIVTEVAEERKWIRNKNNDYCYVATTYPGFFSGSWGELITIIFDKNRIYFNSICNPNEKSSIISMGRNRKHYLTLLNQINKASH
ncbi:hypothetical protein [Flavobacterium sp. GP15]|uniref:hypothetical protein n=1 Tax=Flavobacterium sp. GP15 TaxID=2758567 RepID=UPI00165E2AA9|nr:hypothetical protein [Flavobacterium sp. GP15]